jgi:hypothetical protein
MNVGTLRAFECAEVETHASGHDAREHHMSTALWASWAMNMNASDVRQEQGVLHDASLKVGGSTTLSVTGSVPMKERGDRNNFVFLRSGWLFNIDQCSGA